MTSKCQESPPVYTLSYDFGTDGQAHVVANGGQRAIYSHYHVGDERIARAFGSLLSPELADLVDVAVAVYVADRLCRRRCPEANAYDLQWTRRFYIRLPLRNPELWSQSSVTQSLKKVLWFLTEDKWSFEFVPRTRGHRVAEMQAGLFPMAPAPPVRVALFSGGLDSLAGLCAEIADYQQGSFVLLAGGTNTEARAVQRELINLVRSQFKRELIPVMVPFGLRDRAPGQYSESTQRSRGFLFMAMGAVTAIEAGADELAIYENGVGAINLPYTDAQLGVHNTRAVHPAAVAAMADFVKLVTWRALQFRLPFLFQTKGQLCARLADTGLGFLGTMAMSCDGFPQRVPGHPHCGVCTSCLLRRQALWAAGMQEVDAESHYRHDVLVDLARIPDRKLHKWKAMLHQVACIRRALRQDRPWQALSRAYPRLLEVSAGEVATTMAGSSATERLVALYRDYCDEWSRLPAAQSSPLLKYRA